MPEYAPAPPASMLRHWLIYTFVYETDITTNKQGAIGPIAAYRHYHNRVGTSLF